MATISSPGIGSQLDVKSIVSQLVELEKRPLQQLQITAATVQTKISAYGEVKSLVSSLSSAASALSSLTTWNATTASSSNTNAVTVSAVGGTAANSFSVTVNQLAKAQSYASASISPAGAAIGAGTVSIQVGDYGEPPGTFTPGSGAPVTVTIDADDTLSDVASKINGANATVSATVLNDGTGERLLLRSKATGQAQGFQLSVTDNDGDNADPAGLSRLVNAGTVTQYGENAEVTVNNSIAVTSASNTFTNIVSGVSITLKDGTASGATSEITVAPDTSAFQTALDGFVTAYNNLNTYLAEATKYDAGTKTAGLLQADSFAVGMQNTLRSMLQSSTAGTPLGRLADIGVSQALGGELVVNSTKLTAALQQPEALKDLFRRDNSNPATNGIALKIKAYADGLLNADGLFKSKDDALKRSLTLNSKEQTRVNEKAARVEAALNRRYSALDGQLASLTALSNYVTQQVTTWNKSTG
ncbi:MAG: flagellar hook-associated protein 2 [Pseudomonadota bacterium]|jgi:flagellar hook-associated protein 2